MKKFLLTALLVPAMALAQTFPSPTFNSLTLQNPLTSANGGIGINASALSGVPIFSAGAATVTTTPALGTPSAITLTNGTGLPIGTGVSGLGSGVATGLSNAVTGSGSPVLATSPTLVTPNLGTPSSVTLTNGAGLPISSGVSGLGTGVAAGLANAVTGSGAPVLATSPSISNLTATGTLSLPSNAVTNAFLAQTAAYTEKCNPNSTTGNVTDCNRPNLNVEDFGAKGDNSTDNSTAMGNAITACTNLGGCNLHLSTKTGGKFLMHGVVVPSNINVICENSVFIVNNSTNTYAMQFGNGTTQQNQLGIYGCFFGQASGVTPTAGNIGLAANLVGSFRIHDVTAINVPAALNTGVSLYEANQSYIDGLNVLNSLAAGVILNGGPAAAGGDLYISNSHSDANGTDGWDITDTGGGYFSNVSAYANGGNAWNLYKTSIGNVNLFFDNCVGDTSGSYDWNISSLKIGVFNNVWGATQKSTTVNTFATGFVLSGPGVTDISMTNVVAINNNSHGIAIVNSSGMPQNINIVNPIAGSTGFGNGKASGGGYGIWVDNAATSVTVQGGEALNNTTGAVHLAGTSPSVSITKLQGFNPQLGTVAQPAVPASGTAVTNTTGVDCMVYIVGGTVSSIKVGAAGVFLATPATVLVPANQTITVTYSSAPGWQWSGL